MNARKLVFVLLLIIGGCVPTRYAWSPDGKWMTVMGEKELRICDAGGNLTPGGLSGVNVASWFPDSRRLLVCRQIDVNNWNQLSHYLTPHETQIVADAGDRAAQALLGYDFTARHADSWEAFETWFDAQEEQAGHSTAETKRVIGCIAIYMRSHMTPEQRQKLSPAMTKQLDDWGQPVFSTQVCTVTPTGFSEPTTLMNSLHGAREMRVSPDSAHALLTTDSDNEDQISQLWVMPTDASAPATLELDNSSWYPDWTADSKGVIFVGRSAKQNGPANDTSLGAVTHARVIGGDGKVLEHPDGVDGYAGLLYNALDRARCLPDGRIVFSSVEITLPCAPNDMDAHPQLFCVDPRKPSTVTRLFRRGIVNVVGDATWFFELSPDGSMVTAPGNNGTVWVVNLATGEPTQVQDQPFANKNGQTNTTDLTLPTVPQWRNNDQLTFMVPAPKLLGNVVLYSLSNHSSVVLSASWPPGTIEDKKQ